MFKFKIYFLVFSFIFIMFSQHALAQTLHDPSPKIKWMTPVKVKALDGSETSYLAFQGAQYDSKVSSFPFYYSRIKLNGAPSSATVTLTDLIFIPLTDNERAIAQNSLLRNSSSFSGSINAEVKIGIIKKESYAFVKFYPFRIDPQSGNVEKLSSFR